MNRKTLLILICVLAIVLVGELIFAGYLTSREHADQQIQSGTTLPTGTQLPSQSQQTTDPSTEPSSEAETDPSTEPSTEPEETQPTQDRFVLTFVGDCTLASSPSQYNSAGGFIKTIGENYDYPFANVVEYFENDDFTMINLESVLADSGNPAGGKTFTFRGPTAYTQILTGSSVEAVTLANNHTMDYGKDGFASTKSALESAGVAYVEANKTMLYTTESGLVIGVYAASFDINLSDMRSDIAYLRNQGADIVICAMHWGNEGKYRPNNNQVNWGHAAIDAGADIVYGHHPHVLQRIEEYGDGVIYYSLGNFCFGGNHFPRDMDSVIVQQEVIRDENGNVSLGEMTLIPVSISSTRGQNNFQPTPYAEGSAEYERTMTKLNGTFTGPDLVVDYSHLEGGDDPDETEPTEPEDPDTGDTGSGDTGSGDTGSGDTGSGDTGSGDTGSGDTGSGDTGSGDTGSGDTGGDSTGGGESTGITDGSGSGGGENTGDTGASGGETA